MYVAVTSVLWSCVYTLNLQNHWDGKTVVINVTCFRSLRVIVLKTLSLWLTVARSSSSVEVYAEDILLLLLADIQSEKQSVTLNVSSILLFVSRKLIQKNI